jgi:hypothetical protein
MPQVPVTWVALAQGAYFVATGVWPLVSLRTFMAVTGPKADGWLVKTFGLLVAAVGVALLTAAARGGVSPEGAVLAVGSVAALAAADVYYVAAGRISRVYLLDAVAEALLIAAWAVALAAGPG